MFRQVANSRKQHLSAEIGCHPEQVKRRLTQAYKNQKQHQIADNERAHARKKRPRRKLRCPSSLSMVAFAFSKSRKNFIVVRPVRSRISLRRKEARVTGYAW
tara:strand:- start:121 stop:426 length:306 start_codon:yes stop_codon:yes gene_type:complete